MSIEVQVVDETTPGSEDSRPTVAVESSVLTLRDLIRERIRQEVTDYNENLPEVYRGLIQPDDSEALLNGYRLKTKKPLDWQRQFDVAIRSFEENGVFVLVNDQAIESLDAAVELRSNTEIRFLRLVPLMGG